MKADLAEAIEERVGEMHPQHLQSLEYDPKLSMRKIEGGASSGGSQERTRSAANRFDCCSACWSKPEEDGQLIVTVPRLGTPPLTFYAYNWDELEETARLEIQLAGRDDARRNLQPFRHARSEYMETLEVDVELKKAKDRQEAVCRFFSGARRAITSGR